ncbi:MAG: hypothetical protein Udaeo2_07690 [Candidatus Udaeobacter sp.]|nr:MAG: hypothetical protein Udaeo2_07690 [Candidatus Udaeobacter sp.]
MIFTANLNRVVEMLEIILEHRLLPRLGQKRQHVNSDHAAFLRQRFNSRSSLFRGCM